MSLPIEKESDDIFEQEEGEEEEEDLSEDEEEEFDRDESERKAAAALTSLVGSRVVEANPAAVQTKNALTQEFKIPLRFTKSGRKRAVPFPMKLMKVLTEEKNSSIISWLPSGKAFAVHKPKLFVAQILGRVFKSAKYSSFTRKLHRWGFMRHYRGEEAGSFYHELFQKDRLDLCEKMTCHKTDTVVKAPAAKKTKPAAAPQSKKDAPVHRPVATLTRNLTPRSSMTGSVTSMVVPQGRPPISSFEMPVVGGPLQLPNAAAAADLNAAIEMEVSRRLKERINQAALSRQALLVMQQQEAKARQEQQLRYQLAMLQQQQHIQQQQQQQMQQQQQQQQMQQQQQRLGLPPNVTAGLVRHLAALKFGPSASFKPNTSPNFQQAFASPSMGLPPTNIQGAKTA